jgi:hypothetical protein
MAMHGKLVANLPFAPIVAALFACVAVALVIATPQWLFERWVALSGIAGIIPAATPPLGEKARIAAALFAGLATGAAIWAGLTLAARVMAPRSRPAARGSSLDPAWPLTPLPETGLHRRPLFADTELGAPLMSEEAMTQAREELVLDAPLAEAELAANVEEPRSLPEVVPLPQPEMTEPVPEPSPRGVTLMRPVADESIATLLDRLEAALALKPVGYRPDRTDIASLRRAMGQARN